MIKYLWCYAQKMKVNCFLNAEMINSFKIKVILDIRNRIKELKASHNEN